MIDKQKYEQLKRVIQEANPDRFGLRDPHAAPTEYEHKYQRCGDCFCTIQETHTHYKDDIRLADVLLAMQKNNVAPDIRLFDDRTKGLMGLENDFIYMRHGNATEWNLRDNNLDHDETKQFLISLLT